MKASLWRKPIPYLYCDMTFSCMTHVFLVLQKQNIQWKKKEISDKVAAQFAFECRLDIKIINGSWIRIVVSDTTNLDLLCQILHSTVYRRVRNFCLFAFFKDKSVVVFKTRCWLCILIYIPYVYHCWRCAHMHSRSTSNFKSARFRLLVIFNRKKWHH